MPIQAPTPLKVRGSALRWTPAEIEARSAVSVADGNDAGDVWRQLAPRKWKLLVDATPVFNRRDLIGLGRSVSRFFFDDSRQLYGLSSNRRYIPTSEIKKAVNQFTANAAAQMQTLTRQMTDGSLTLGQWQTQMSEQLKGYHLAATSVGRGGLQNVLAEDLAFAQGELQFQNERLARFALQVERGEITADSPKKINDRVALYGNAVNPTFERTKHDNAEAAQMTEERRVLGAAEHCETCVEQAELGWSPIGTLNEISDSECRWNCACSFEFRRTDPE